MAEQQNRPHANTNDVSNRDTPSQDTVIFQPNTNRPQVNATTTREMQPGTGSRSGGNDVENTIRVGQSEETGHDNLGTTATGTQPDVIPQLNSPAGPEDGDDHYASGQSHLSHLSVANFNDGTDGSDGSMTVSSHDTQGENVYVANQSDSYRSDIGSDSSSTQQEMPDLDFFVDRKTLVKPDTNSLYGPRVRHSLCRITGPRKTALELVEALRRDLDPSERDELLKQVRRKLRQLMKDKSWTELASFLALEDVRSEAVESLEILLMDLRKSQDTTVRDQLLQVATVSKEVILELGDKSPNLLPLLTLHFMTLSALLCRCPLPTQEDFSRLAIPKKLTKKKGGGEGLKQTMLRTLQTFHEGLEDVLEQAGSFRDGVHWELWQQPPEKRKMFFARSSFCEMIVSVFSLLSEVKHHGWGEDGEHLLEVLRDLCENSCSVSTTKQKQSEECKGALAFFLVRQMVLLLRKTFEADKPQVGTQDCKHQKLITDMLMPIAENATSTVRRCILEEVKCLIFHKAMVVRQLFNYFWVSKENVSILAQGYIAKELRNIGFQLCNSGSFSHSESQNKVNGVCTWNRFTCTVGKKPAEAAMFIRKLSCLGCNQLEVCLREHPGRGAKCAERREELREESQIHIRNLDMLKELSPSCKHVLKLYSYQILPFPMYITEQVSHHRVLDHLLAHREALSWLGTFRSAQIATQFTEAMIFFHSRNLDPRGVTCYSSVVQPGPDFENHCLSSDSKYSELTKGGFTIKLADLGRTHQLIDSDAVYNCVETRPVDDQGPVPVRWLSPEALFEGRYGEKNMVYNLGCLFYELWTHGLQPYSSYDANMTTEDILKKMLTQPGSIELASRPCIPEEVYKLIKDCTAHSRPSLDTVLKKLKQLSAGLCANGREPGLERALSLKKRYPEISRCQKDRKHVPEMGLPKSIQELLLAGKNSDLYSKARRSSTIIPCKHNVVTEEELKAPDWIHITHQEDRTVVEEKVSTQFVQDVLPSLRASDQYGVTCYSQTDEGQPRLSKRDDMIVHKREYPPSVSLETAAREDLLWETPNMEDVYDGEESVVGVLKPLKSLARVLVDLHDKGWYAGDLREEHVLVDKESGEVMLPRIGRMYRLSSSDKYMVDEVPEDSRRRAGPEVLVNGRYGKENDIFMFGVLMLQLYRIRDIAREPTATRRHFAPYPNVHKDKLTDYVRDPNRDQEEQPMRCPDWMYDLSMRCRDPDPEKRPTAIEVFNILNQHWTEGPVRTPFISRDCQTPSPMTTEPAHDEGRDTVQLRQKKREKIQSSPLPSRSLFRNLTARWTHKKGTTGLPLKNPFRAIKERLTTKPRQRQTYNCSSTPELSARNPLGNAESPVMAPEIPTEHVLGPSSTDPYEAYNGVFSQTVECHSFSAVEDETYPSSFSDQTIHLFPSEKASRQPEQPTGRSVGTQLKRQARYNLQPIEETNSGGSSSSDNSSLHTSRENNQKATVDIHAVDSPQTSCSQNIQGSSFSMPPLKSSTFPPRGSQVEHIQQNQKPDFCRLSNRFPLWHPISVPPTEKPNPGEVENSWPEFYQSKLHIQCQEICEELYDHIDDADIGRNGLETGVTDQFEAALDEVYDSVDDDDVRSGSEEEHATILKRDERQTGRKDLKTEVNKFKEGQDDNGINVEPRAVLFLKQKPLDQSTITSPELPKTAVPKAISERIGVSNQSGQETVQCKTKHRGKTMSWQSPATGMPSSSNSGKRHSSRKRPRTYTENHGCKGKPTQEIITMSQQKATEALDDDSTETKLPKHSSEIMQSVTGFEDHSSCLSGQDSESTFMSREQAMPSSARYYPEDDDYSKLNMSYSKKSSGRNFHSQLNNQHKIYAQNNARKAILSEHKALRDPVDSIHVSDEYSPSTKHGEGYINHGHSSVGGCRKPAASVPKKTFASKQNIISSCRNPRNVCTRAESTSRRKVTFSFDGTSEMESNTSTGDTRNAVFRAQTRGIHSKGLHYGDEGNHREVYNRPRLPCDFTELEQSVSNTRENLTTVPMGSTACPSMTAVSMTSTARPGATVVSMASTAQPSMTNVPITSHSENTNSVYCIARNIFTTASMPPAATSAVSTVSPDRISMTATPVTATTRQSMTAASVTSNACLGATAAFEASGIEPSTLLAATTPTVHQGLAAESITPSVCENMTMTLSANDHDRQCAADEADGRGWYSNWIAYPSVDDSFDNEPHINDIIYYAEPRREEDDHEYLGF